MKKQMDTFKTLVLGTSGAGKTVFLASMYKKLCVQNRELGFFISAPAEQRKYLLEQFRILSASNQGWPRATMVRDLKKFNFTCSVRSKRGNLRLFTFSYLDYAGGLLTDPSESRNPQITQFYANDAKHADALLILLDGYKIFHQLEGKLLSGMHSLWHDLDHLAVIIQNSVHHNKPVHFVLTKWDLLSSKYGLADVRKLLFSHESFASIVRQRNHIPTRLIPTSAVGMDFAKLNKAGHVEKVPGVPLNPFQVEMSMACLLYDIFREIDQDVEDAYRSPWVLIKKWLIKIGFLAADIGIKVSKPTILAPFISYGLKVLIKKSYQELKRRQEVKLATIQNQKDALESIFLSYHILIRELEHKFPESDLTKVLA